MKGYRQFIEEKLHLHLKLLINSNIDQIFDKNTCKHNLINIIPIDIEQYIKMNELAIERLYAINIKLGYRKYIRIINNKIKEIIANDSIKTIEIIDGKSSLIDLDDNIKKRKKNLVTLMMKKQ